MSLNPRQPFFALWFIGVVLIAILAIASVVVAGSPAEPSAPLSIANLIDPKTILGSPLRIVVGGDSSIQVYHSRWGNFGQVYGWQDGSADSGVWLRVGDEIYGPDACFAGRATKNLFTVRPWARISQTGPTGSGTAADPWVITTVLDAGTTGVRVTQRASYMNGQDYFRLQWDVSNFSGSSQAITLFHAADSYFANDDYGQGYHDAASGAVGSYVSGGPWYMLFVPQTPANSYKEGWYFDVWLGIGYCGDNQSCPVSGSCSVGPGFDNTIDTSPDGVDNGFGLQWQRTIGSGASTTVGDWWTFGSIPSIPGQGTSTTTPTQTRTPTPTASRTPTVSPTPTPGGCGLTPPEAGTIVRTLAYHQITTLSPNGVWDTARGAIISANGQRAAFTSGYDPTRFYVMNADDSGSPMEVDARTGDGGVGSPYVEISADGSRLITVGAQKDYWIVRAVNADGSDLHTVITLGRYLIFRLSGDGSQVFFQNPEDFDLNGQHYKAGLYAVSVTNSAQVRKIVDRDAIATLYGVDPNGVRFAGGDSNYFAASRDGSRFVFSVAPTYHNARVLRVNGDGSALAEYSFPSDYFWHVENLGISGDGSKVFYLGQQNPCCSAPYELGVFGFGGGTKTVLGDYGGPNTDGQIAQLSHDGSKLYYVGTLYNTDASGRLALAIPGPGLSGDPPLIINNYGLFQASMTDSATRFLYKADYNTGQPLQLAILDVNPASLGLAPAVTNPKIAPPYVLADGSSASTVSSHVSTNQTLVRVNGVSLRDGVSDNTVLNGGAILLDDGTQGDVTAGDGIFTSNRAWGAPPLGPRLVRMRAEVRAGDGKRHSTALDVAQLDVVNQVPPGMGTCTPTPTPTQTRTPTPTMTPTRTPTPTVGLPDLTVSRLEVNQAIQNDAKSIPLIASKRTVVRTYVGLASSMPIGSVTAQLKGYRGATLLGTVAPFNPGGRITVVQPVDWRQINHTLNFEVPFGWLAGDVRLEVEVNNDHAVAESNYGNNVGSVNVRFVDGGGLRIAWQPIHYVTGGYTGPQDPTERIAKGDAWLKATYPVSHTRVKYYPWPGITWGGNVNTGTGGVKLLNYLNRLLQISQTSPRPDHVYAWLPANVYGGNGLAWLPGQTAFGNDTDGRWRRTFAHELGHNRNIGHWDATIRIHGFDVAAREVRQDTRLDFMVPGRLENEAWVAPEIYTYLHDRMSTVYDQSVGAAKAVAGEYLLASGLINQDGTASFDSFYRQVQTDPLDNPPVGTAYCLELYDAGNTELSSQCFDVSYGFGDSATPVTTAPFALTVPFPPTAKRIVLAHGGTTVATRTVSNNAPTVSATLPGGGVVKTINWTANDPDGDILSYSVLYSAHNKNSWFAVAMDLNATTYSLDTSTLPGGTNAFVRILASDGVNTGQGDAGPFVVTGKEPTALIDSPADGATYPPGQTVVLVGDGFDLEDSSLPDSSLGWLSDRDGVLGTGRTIERSDLSEGTHHITLVAMDSQGNQATDSITLRIRRPNLGIYLPLIVR